MGKKEKKQRHQRPSRREASYYLEQDDEGHDYSTFPTSSKPPVSDDEEKKEVETEDENGGEGGDSMNPSSDAPSKFLLYQQSVQVSLVSLLLGLQLFRKLLISLLNAVAERRHKILAEVLSYVCWWEASPSSAGRFLRHCSSKVRSVQPTSDFSVFCCK